MMGRMQINKLYESEDNILISWDDIKDNIREFYTLIALRIPEKNLPNIPLKIPIRLSLAKTALDNARSLLIAKLNSLDNPHIIKYSHHYHAMRENIGRVDYEIKVATEELMKQTEEINKFSKDKAVSVKATQVSSLLHRSMMIFVINPILRASELVRKAKKHNRLTDKEKQIIIDEDLFTYWVFRDLYQSSESIGSISAQYPPGLARKVMPQQGLERSQLGNLRLIPERALRKEETPIDIFDDLDFGKIEGEDDYEIV